MFESARIPWAEVVRVAFVAGVSPWTLRRYLVGKPTRSTTSGRISSALTECGYPHLAR